MDLEPGMWLCDELASIAILLCNKCHQLLTSPVKLREKLGKVCYDCYLNQGMQDDPSLTGVALKNSLADTLLQKTLFRCDNIEQGCKDFLRYTQLTSHGEVCAYKMISCVDETCSWFGKRTDYETHLSVSHDTDKFYNVLDVFDLKGDVFAHKGDAPCDIIRLINERFVCRIRIKQNKFWLLIYTSDPVDRVSVIYSIGSTGKKVVAVTDYKVINDIRKLCDLDSTVPILDGTIETAQAEFIMAVQVYEKHVQMNFNLLKCLECFVCKKYMKPPIRQCIEGHSICDYCWSIVLVCVKCNSSYSRTRNYSLEKITLYLKYPCQNESCKVNYILSSDHELICNYRQWSCPLVWCGYSSNYGSLKDHLVDKHYQKSLVDDEDVFTIQPHCLAKNLRFTSYFIVYDRIFEMHYQHTHKEDKMSRKFAWEVNIVGPKSELNFNFEVHIYVGDRRKRKQFSFLAPCEYEGSDPGNCIIVDEVTLSKVLDGNTPLTFYVTIVKRL